MQQNKSLYNRMPVIRDPLEDLPIIKFLYRVGSNNLKCISFLYVCGEVGGNAVFFIFI